jgi:transcriptional regulator
MYTPRFNQIADRRLLIEAMQAYSFAILCGPQGGEQLTATHLPLVVTDEGEHGLLTGHFARANAHWKALAGREVLVVFPGPHSYVSPTLYTDPLSVPTWNYIAIHAYGALELIEGNEGKETVLKSLMMANEAAEAAKWQAMPEDFRQSLLKQIVAFRIEITRIEGKFKISQNRAAEERRNVEAAHQAGSDDQQALAEWMKRLETHQTR